MTVKEFCFLRLDDYLIHNGDKEKIFAFARSGLICTLGEVEGRGIEGYGPHYARVMSVSIRAAALEWLKINKPRHIAIIIIEMEDKDDIQMV